jgi:hypothetical protein
MLACGERGRGRPSRNVTVYFCEKRYAASETTLYGSSGQPERVRASYLPDWRPAWEGATDEHGDQGRWVEISPMGVVCRGSYVDQRRHGTWQCTYPDGSRRATAKFFLGIPIGRASWLAASGEDLVHAFCFGSPGCAWYLDQPGGPALASEDDARRVLAESRPQGERCPTEPMLPLFDPRTPF